MSIHNEDVYRNSVIFLGYFLANHCPVATCKPFAIKKPTDKYVILSDEFIRIARFMMSIGVDNYADEYTHYMWHQCKTPEQAAASGHLIRINGGWKLTETCAELCRKQFLTMGDRQRPIFKYSLETFARIYNKSSFRGLHA